MADYPYVPEMITVHLGAPDQAAQNVEVPFLEYIQNVASSELYPTWPENALRANIYAEVSFALNRVYTEWYRARGYDFDITNSTAYDQAYVAGRNIFENVAELVGDQFNRYLARPGFIQPLFAVYCDGRRVQCDGLSQWGSVDLAEQGMSPYDILLYYYGGELDIRSAPVRPSAASFPGYAVRLGDVSLQTEIIQTRLNRISDNYPAIPKIYPVNGVFDAVTENAVINFQRIFNLTPDGVVGAATWYQILAIYNAVLRLAELDAEGVTLQDVERQYPGVLAEGSRGDSVRLLQFYLSVVGAYNEEIPSPSIDGVFGAETKEAVTAFQQFAGLTADGIVGADTWRALLEAYDQIAASNPTFGEQETVPLPPSGTLVLGSRSDRVLELQQLLNRLAAAYPEIETIPETGYFGEQTREAVLAFQELFGLTPSGFVSPYTFYQLELAVQRLGQ